MTPPRATLIDAHADRLIPPAPQGLDRGDASLILGGHGDAVLEIAHHFIGPQIAGLGQLARRAGRHRKA